MDIERIKEIRLKQDGLSNTLGMEFLSTPDPDTCQPRMHVDHVKAVREGDTVTATARILHKGKTLHQWHIEICNGAGELISSVEITNFVMKGKDGGKPQKE